MKKNFCVQTTFLLLGLTLFFISCEKEGLRNYEEFPDKRSSLTMRACKTFQDLLGSTLRRGEEIFLSDIDSLPTEEDGTTLYLANFRNNGYLLFRENKLQQMEIVGYSENSSMHYADTLHNTFFAECIIKPVLRGKKLPEPAHLDPVDEGIPLYNPQDPGSHPWYTCINHLISSTRYCEPSVYPLFDQREPFNALIKEGHPIGCGPIAIATLLSYYETQVGGSKVNWKELKKNYCSLAPLENIHDTNLGLLREIQVMMRDIWTYCRVCSNKKFTMATSKNILGYLRRNGFKAECYKYKDFNLYKHFYDGTQTPLIIQGWDTPTTAHYWVIDAAENNKYEIITEKYIPKTRERTIVAKREEEIVFYHCVWGWGGRENGWYNGSYFHAGKTILKDDNKKGLELRLASPNEEDHYLPTKVYQTWKYVSLQ